MCIFRKLFLIGLFVFSLSGCGSQKVAHTANNQIAFLSRSAQNVLIQESSNKNSRVLHVVPNNKIFISRKISNNCWYIIYGEYEGYIHRPKFKSQTAFAVGDLKDYAFNNEVGYYYYPESQRIANILDTESQESVAQPTQSTASPTTTRSSSTYSPSTGGTVHVRGYYRKDGTYVRPHTRRAPTRRR